MDKSQRYNQHCWNQSRPLQFTSRSTRKQGLSFQSIWLVRNCNRAVRFVQSARPATKTNQNTLLTQNERTETVGTNQDLFCIHAEVLANKKEGRDPSRWCGTAIHLAFCPATMPQRAKQMDQNTLLTQNKMTDTIGTSQDLFCIHAEALANKKEGCDPSSSWGIALKPTIGSSCVEKSAKWSKCKGWVSCIHFHWFKVIKTSSVYMLKCSQTRMEHPIHLVHEEFQ